VFTQFLPALRMLVILTMLTGVAYPYLVTGIAQFAFPHAANGSATHRSINAWACRVLRNPAPRQMVKPD